jgi:CRP/FNR family cyclic AMP-dependent transcriptional regulator
MSELARAAISALFAVPNGIRRGAQRDYNLQEAFGMAQTSLIPEIFAKREGPGRKLLKFQRGEIIFRQGGPADSIYFIVAGRIRLSVTDRDGKQATLGLLGPNELFGHQCLMFGRKTRIMTAQSVAASEVVMVPLEKMNRLLERDSRLAKFVLRDTIAQMVGYEDALVHQIINNNERRLARVLLKLAKYDQRRGRPTVIEGISHEVLAEIVGASRPRISGFMNKFRRLGHIEYSGSRITVGPSLISILLRKP